MINVLNLSIKNWLKIKITDIFILNTTPNTSYLLNFEAIANNTSDNKSGAISGIIKIN